MQKDAIRKSLWRLLDAKQQPEICQLRAQLKDMGMRRDVIRQRINRFRKDRYDTSAVLQHLKGLIGERSGCKKAGPSTKGR